MEIEETIALTALPDGVSTTLRAEADKGKVQKAEKLTKGNTIQYEFVVASAKEKRGVVMDPAGKIVKTTKMKSGAEED